MSLTTMPNPREIPRTKLDVHRPMKTRDGRDVAVRDTVPGLRWPHIVSVGFTKWTVDRHGLRYGNRECDDDVVNVDPFTTRLTDAPDDEESLRVRAPREIAGELEPSDAADEGES